MCSFVHANACSVMVRKMNFFGMINLQVLSCLWHKPFAFHIVVKEDRGWKSSYFASPLFWRPFLCFLHIKWAISTLLLCLTVHHTFRWYKDCTYSHFQSSSNCPECGRLLGEDDFTEIIISDSTGKFTINPDEILQNLLTKASLQPGTPITWNDLCATVMHEQDAILTNAKIFVKVSTNKNLRSQIVE